MNYLSVYPSGMRRITKVSPQGEYSQGKADDSGRAMINSSCMLRHISSVTCTVCIGKAHFDALHHFHNRP